MEKTLKHSDAIKIVRSVLFNGSLVSLEDLAQEAQIAYLKARSHPEHGIKKVFVIGKVRTRILDCARKELRYIKCVTTWGIKNKAKTKMLQGAMVAPEPETIVTPENFDWLMSVVDRSDQETQAIVRGYLNGQTFSQIGNKLNLSRQTVSRRLSDFIQMNQREE